MMMMTPNSAEALEIGIYVLITELLITGLVCGVCCIQTDQILQLSAFIDAEVDYHHQSVDVLQSLLESLRERSVLWSLSSLREPQEK